MKDNGLLKYYQDKHKAKTLINKKNLLNDNNENVYIPLHGNVRAVTLPEGDFYIKKVGKHERDAEILLSQIYAKAGFTTAIYTPVGSKGFYTHVASNDIKQGKNLISQKMFNRNNHVEVKQDIEDSMAKFNIGENMFYMPQSKQEEHIDYSKYITKEAMQTLIKMRLFDVAGCNTDRHGTNFFLDVEDNVVKDIALIDYSMSGRMFSSKQELFFINEFSAKSLSDFEFLKELEKNEIARDYISLQECAESVGSVDVLGTAQEIKEEIGYKLDSKYVDKIASSFDMFATGISMLK